MRMMQNRLFSVAIITAVTYGWPHYSYNYFRAVIGWSSTEGWTFAASGRLAGASSLGLFCTGATEAAAT